MNLRLDGVQRRYGEKTVLDVDHVEIEDGKVTGIIGPNGAGKTTLLNIIAGLDTASAGKVLYGHRNEHGVEELLEKIPRQNMTLLFQHPYIMHTSVEKNIAYPLKLRHVPKEETEARVKELMAELGVSSLAEQHGHSLSGGEMQKVAFARALSFHPQLLLMDEPTSSIDNASSIEIENIIRKENVESNMTIVIIGHDFAQIKRLCDNVIFMHHGRILESGTVEEVLTNPQHDTTKAFVGGKLIV